MLPPRRAVPSRATSPLEVSLAMNQSLDRALSKLNSPLSSKGRLMAALLHRRLRLAPETPIRREREDFKFRGNRTQPCQFAASR